MALPRALVAQAGPPEPLGGDVSPPAAIAGLDTHPAAPLEFSRGWLGKAELVRRRRAELLAAGMLDGMSPEAVAAEGGALAGLLRVPVIPVRYVDVPAPFEESVLRERLFGPSRGDSLSYSAYWSEVSGGLIRVEGAVTPWVVLNRGAGHYLSKSEFGWARFGRIDEFREQALRKADQQLDFGAFDNDGLDGVPNSGDDDGFVDFVAFVYAARCGGDWRAGSIWPHRGAMRPFETNDAAAGGGRIRVTDYLVQAAVEPGGCQPMHIGVLAHETGHVFGLPDLYDYDGSSQGIGAWGLMGLGSHNARWSPAHPSAWEKEQLGWVRVDWLRGEAYRLRVGAVQRERVVYRVDLAGSAGDYLLFENRQLLGSDAQLPGTGLLVWRVDPEPGEMGAWNNDERRAAVRLLEADGRGDLSRGRNADAGDPFPGLKKHRSFELVASRPVRLTEIAEEGDDILVDLSQGHGAFTLAAEPSVVDLVALVGHDATPREVQVALDGAPADEWTVHASAGWIQVERVGRVLRVGASAALLQTATYTDTVRVAAPGARSAHVVVRLRVSEHGATEVIATGLTWSWGLAAEAGRIVQASYGWDALGLRPRPRLLQIRDGESHPATLARLPADALYAPVPGPSGSSYVLARAEDENYLYRVDADGGAEVLASNFGAGPVYGATALPGGDILVAEWSGQFHRIAPDGTVRPWGRLNARIYQIAADSEGTVYAATYEGNIIRLTADGAGVLLRTGFSPGRLVALAAGEPGTVYAAERGGEGRIIRVGPDGARSQLTRVRGGEFYGLAVDGPFLYALDLAHRQLLRLPVTQGSAPALASRP